MLLEATHKHNAALKEISRLKTEGGLGADPDTDTSVRYGRTVKLDINLFGIGIPSLGPSWYSEIHE